MIETMFHFQSFEKNLRTLNSVLERFLPILTPLGVVLGLLLGFRVPWMKPAVTWMFAFITFSGALGISSREFRKVIVHPRPIFIFLLGAAILIPIIGFVAANLCFPDNDNLVTGYILLFSIPTAVVGYVWSSIYEGNGALSLSLILISTILAPLVTPFTVRLLANTSVVIDTTGMMLSLLKMVVIPSILGTAINNLSRGKVTEHLVPDLKPLAKILLLAVVVINTAQVAKKLIDNATWQYVPIAGLCAVLTIIGFPLAFALAKGARLSREDTISVTFAASMRNISAALVLAIDYFPPESSLPIIFGIVFQQSVCAIMAQVLFGRRNSIKNTQAGITRTRS